MSERSTGEILASASRVVETLLDDEELKEVNMALLRDFYHDLSELSIRVAFLEYLFTDHGGVKH